VGELDRDAGHQLEGQRMGEGMKAVGRGLQRAAGAAGWLVEEAMGWAGFAACCVRSLFEDDC
jgi:hypothetical protein